MLSPINNEKMNIVIAGHVDHGKSTIIGRLLADTNSIPVGKLEKIQELCEKESKTFEWAFLIDALEDERAKGITIDCARAFFKSKKRNYMVLDAPGHIEFLKNMVTGASQAESALLIIDAKEGVKENSRRHGYIISMLGIKNVAIVVNKMDLVNYDESKFNSIKHEYLKFLSNIQVSPTHFIPASAKEGENISISSDKMPWYQGETVLSTLDRFPKSKVSSEQPLRIPIQGVYKFSNKGDDRRIISGTITSGSISVNQEVMFLPSGKKGKVKSIETFNTSQKQTYGAGEAIGITFEDQKYPSRGEIISDNSDISLNCSTRFNSNIFWLGKKNLDLNREFTVRIGTNRSLAKIEKINKVLNASTLEFKEFENEIKCNEVANCSIMLKKPIAYDTDGNLPDTNRFVIVDEYEISGGGIILEALHDKASGLKLN